MSYPRVANSVESSVMDEKLSFQNNINIIICLEEHLDMNESFVIESKKRMCGEDK